MDVRDAVASRFSCRAFLDKPVPEEIVREILERAARAPSGGNLQPWIVSCDRGRAARRIEGARAPPVTMLPWGEGAEYDIYPARSERALQRAPHSRSASRSMPRSACRAKTGPARYRQYARNYEFYDAPVGLCSFDRPQHGPAAMVGSRRLYPERHAARARLRPAHLPAGGVDALAQDHLRACSTLPARIDPVLRHGARLCRRERRRSIPGARRASRWTHSRPSAVSGEIDLWLSASGRPIGALSPDLGPNNR